VAAGSALKLAYNAQFVWQRPAAPAMAVPELTRRRPAVPPVARVRTRPRLHRAATASRTSRVEAEVPGGEKRGEDTGRRDQPRRVRPVGCRCRWGQRHQEAVWKRWLIRGRPDGLSRGGPAGCGCGRGRHAGFGAADPAPRRRLPPRGMGTPRTHPPRRTRSPGVRSRYKQVGVGLPGGAGLAGRTAIPGRCPARDAIARTRSARGPAR
jgi:hypothetical protein